MGRNPLKVAYRKKPKYDEQVKALSRILVEKWDKKQIQNIEKKYKVKLTEEQINDLLKN